MKTHSAKRKGKRLQATVRRVLLEHFPHLQDDDVQVVYRSRAGADITLSPRARGVFPYSVECKNVERLNVWGALAQAQTNTGEGTTALLVFGRNRTEPHVALPLAAFMNLLTAATRAADPHPSP